MVITLSDTSGIKQYGAPRAIKKILLFTLLFAILFIGGLLFYIQSLNSKVLNLEHNNKTLANIMQKDSTLRETFEKKQLELDTVKKEKLELKTKLEQEKVALEKKLQEKIKQLLVDNEKIESQNRITHKEKNESYKLLDELTTEIKQIEKELEKEIKIKEKLKKKLSFKIKRKKEKIKKEQDYKKRLAQRKLKREKLLAKIAKAKLGKRYVWGAVGPATFDCSGFTSYVYKKTGVNIPRTSREQSKYGKYIQRKSLKPGDLIFFDTSRRKKGIVNHVGIYLGNNKFIHASSAKKSVVVTSLGKSFYSNRYKWARRVIN